MSEHLFDSVHGLIRRKIKSYDLTSEELCQLPLAYYKKEAKGYEINMAWNRLSEEYKKELKMHLQCTGYWSKSEISGMDFPDGPLPKRKDCSICMLNK
ncbi:hypothetical protein HHI36_001021 [Cryptolaemus montrouzieri]|uniref:Uncharacterized protein n=1 Tax=Cryptolaemus montrouzieri TaxID=559131 RepID=A0ABD2P6G0_9CUCU